MLFSSIRYPFSVFCISETWLNESDKDLYSFPSYSCEYFHRASSGHGGSAIFILSGISYKRRSDLQVNITDCESVWVEIDGSTFGSNDKNILFGSIYRSPSSSVSDFCSALTSLLQTVAQEQKNVIIMGDININLLDDSQSFFQDYTNCYQGFGFESLINLPTRCNNLGHGTLIDHALSNLLSPPEAIIIRTNITDHYPVVLRFPPPMKTHRKQFTKSVFNKVQFLELISHCDWTSITSSTDAQTSYSDFCEMIANCISA